MHRCNIANGAGRVPETMQFGGKLGDFGTVDSLAFLLAVAVDLLAEWEDL